MEAISKAIGELEAHGHFGPFAVVLGQGLFLVAQTPDQNGYVLPQDRIIPFLGSGSLLRSSTLDKYNGHSGVVVGLGGSPIELVVATDMSLQFLQVTTEPQIPFPRTRENRFPDQGGQGDCQALFAGGSESLQRRGAEARKK